MCEWMEGAVMSQSGKHTLRATINLQVFSFIVMLGCSPDGSPSIAAKK
jgi:hypothetical protein